MDTPEFDEDYAIERWREGSKYFFSFSPATYTYRGPKVRPAPPRPEGFVDESDYNFTGTMDTQYHHRSITPEVDDDIDRRKDSIDDYYEEMRQRKDSGLEPIPWKEWLNRTAFIRNANEWEYGNGLGTGHYTLGQDPKADWHRYREDLDATARNFDMDYLKDGLWNDRPQNPATLMDILRDKAIRHGRDPKQVAIDLLGHPAIFPAYKYLFGPDQHDTGMDFFDSQPPIPAMPAGYKPVYQLKIVDGVNGLIDEQGNDHMNMWDNSKYDLSVLTSEPSGAIQWHASRTAFIRNACRYAMAWEDWAPKIQGGCDGGSCRGEGRYTIPQAGAFLNYGHGTTDV